VVLCLLINLLCCPAVGHISHNQKVIYSLTDALLSACFKIFGGIDSQSWHSSLLLFTCNNGVNREHCSKHILGGPQCFDSDLIFLATTLVLPMELTIAPFTTGC
jgi:hypothetical protein